MSRAQAGDRHTYPHVHDRSRCTEHLDFRQSADACAEWRVLQAYSVNSVRKEATHPECLSSDDYDINSVAALYWEPVLHWIRSTGKVRGGEVEEVRQEVFLRLTREIQSGRRYSLPIRAVVFQITIWTIKGYVADAAGNRERERSLGDMPGDEPVDHSAAHDLDRVGQDEVVEALFARLNDRERTLMTMHYLDGRSLAEVARAMGITPNNAHQIHHRAKDRIGQWLVEDGT